MCRNAGCAVEKRAYSYIREHPTQDGKKWMSLKSPGVAGMCLVAWAAGTQLGVEWCGTTHNEAGKLYDATGAVAVHSTP